MDDLGWYFRSARHLGMSAAVAALLLLSCVVGLAGSAHAQSAAPAGRLSAEDRLDILEIANRFTFFLQEGAIDDLAALFAEDGTIDHPAGHGEGRAAVRQFFAGYFPATKGVRLNSINPVVVPNTDGTVTMRSALLVTRAFGAGETAAAPYLIAHATLTDTLRREGGQWVIAKRTVDRVAVSPMELNDAAERARWAKLAAERGLTERR
jgi:hypothetical protein